MNTFTKFLILSFFFSVFVIGKNNAPDTNKQDIKTFTATTFSNLLARAKKQFATAKDEQEQLVWVLSNLWLSIDESVNLIDAANDEIVNYITVFEEQALVDFYKKQAEQIRKTEYKANSEITKHIEKLRAQLKKASEAERTKRRRLLDKGTKTLKDNLKKLEAELLKQKNNFDKMKNKQIKELNKQMSAAQKQLKSIGSSAKNIKIPSVPKAPKIPRGR